MATGDGAPEHRIAVSADAEKRPAASGSHPTVCPAAGTDRGTSYSSVYVG